jgi:hypothetical protein
VIIISDLVDVRGRRSKGCRNFQDSVWEREIRDFTLLPIPSRLAFATNGTESKVGLRNHLPLHGQNGFIKSLRIGVENVLGSPLSNLFLCDLFVILFNQPRDNEMSTLN